MKAIVKRAPVLAPLLCLGACVAAGERTGSLGAGALAGADTAVTGKPLQRGLGTWYGPGFYGRRTASGERLSAGALTAAHRWLPFGTRVRVVHEGTGRSVVVRINDRGGTGVIDLAPGAARAIGLNSTSRVALYRAD